MKKRIAGLLFTISSIAFAAEVNPNYFYEPTEEDLHAAYNHFKKNVMRTPADQSVTEMWLNGQHAEKGRTYPSFLGAFNEDGTLNDNNRKQLIIAFSMLEDNFLHYQLGYRRLYVYPSWFNGIMLFLRLHHEPEVDVNYFRQLAAQAARNKDKERVETGIREPILPGIKPIAPVQPAVEPAKPAPKPKKAAPIKRGKVKAKRTIKKEVPSVKKAKIVSVKAKPKAAPKRGGRKPTRKQTIKKAATAKTSVGKPARRVTTRKGKPAAAKKSAPKKVGIKPKEKPAAPKPVIANVNPAYLYEPTAADIKEAYDNLMNPDHFIRMVNDPSVMADYWLRGISADRSKFNSFLGPLNDDGTLDDDNRRLLKIAFIMIINDFIKKISAAGYNQWPLGFIQFLKNHNEPQSAIEYFTQLISNENLPTKTTE